MEFIKIINKSELTRVRPDDVLYFEADGNYTNMVLRTGRVFKFTKLIKDFASLLNGLDNNPFTRVGRSYLVNRNYIFQINVKKQHIILGGNGMSTEKELSTKREPIHELMETLKEEIAI